MFFIRRPVRENIERLWGIRGEREGDSGQLWEWERGLTRRLKDLTTVDHLAVTVPPDALYRSPYFFLPDLRYQLDRDDQSAGHPRTQVTRTY